MHQKEKNEELLNQPQDCDHLRKLWNCSWRMTRLDGEVQWKRTYWPGPRGSRGGAPAWWDGEVEASLSGLSFIYRCGDTGCIEPCEQDRGLVERTDWLKANTCCPSRVDLWHCQADMINVMRRDNCLYNRVRSKWAAVAFYSKRGLFCLNIKVKTSFLITQKMM